MIPTHARTGNDFGLRHSERLISLFQNNRLPAVNLIGVGSTCMCDGLILPPDITALHLQRPEMYCIESLMRYLAT